MVKGLDVFEKYFKDYSDKYVLIGGAACDLAMEEAGIDFRATKDIDIVLCVEVLNSAFFKAFWNFIHKGGYQIQQKATGQKQYYRFSKPAASGFPSMLELFSKKPEAFSLAEESHLIPIPSDENISSLSAILLDDEYYRFIHEGKKIIGSISIVCPEHLIPLKAKAWLDLNERKERGENVDKKNITKHKNDIFRLYKIIDPIKRENLTEKITSDMIIFFNKISKEDIDIKALGLGGVKIETVLDDLKKLYGLI